MQRYMKSAMPFLGVPAPGVKQTVRGVPRELVTALDLWENAEFREERYAAIALLPAEPPFPVLERLIVEGAWWDLVDPLVGRVGPRPEMAEWARDENMWKRRTAIICQLHRKDDTDLALLRDAIEANLDDREFFVRKAIGWALRDYAWHNPDWVRSYVAALGARLSPLSRREALKNIDRARVTP